uniref:uncharacterized protein LOC120339753 n=1 Tax=Styela clava TaxID=7725 RepID=UPI00193969A9|nr:uncharacterized protein LOC120339753 [Styela clava]
MSLYSEKLKQNRKKDEEERNTLDRTKCMALKFNDEKVIRREDIWEFFRKLNIVFDTVDGFVLTSRYTVDLTFKTRATAIDVDKKLWELKKVGAETLPFHRLYVPENVAVFVHNVPCPMENKEIKEHFEENHGTIGEVLILKDRFNMKNGIRRFFIKKDDLMKKPIQSYVKLKGHSLFVRYWGQTPTCRICGKAGHIMNNCEYFIPKLERYKDTGQRSPNPEQTKVDETETKQVEKNKIDNTENNISKKQLINDNPTQSTPANEISEDHSEKSSISPTLLPEMFGNMSDISEDNSEIITLNKEEEMQSNTAEKTILYLLEPHTQNQGENSQLTVDKSSSIERSPPRKKKTSRKQKIMTMKEAKDYIHNMSE